MKVLKIYWLLLLLSTTAAAFGQVDYEEIRRRTSDSESETYYPSLLKRFNESDSTLTLEDFELLYYGAVFQKNYSPEKITAVEGRIRVANYAGEYLEAYNIADSLLKEYPVSSQAYFEKAYACFNLKRFDEEEYNNKRYKVLIKTILSSGDGKTFETSYYANTPNDEYETLKFIQVTLKEEAELEYKENSYDVFTLKSNKLKLKVLYFNVTKQKREN